MDNNLDAINHAKNELIDLAIRFGPKVLVAVLVLIAGVMVGGWIGRATERGLARMDLEPPVRLLMVRLVRVVIFALFAILALQNLGVELLPLIAGLSIAGAGIALATQGILSNVFAGLTIIFTKPYRVGDYIEIAGVQGQVQLITIFSTTLLHADRSHVVVPNRKVVGEILHNYGHIRQADITVGVAYDTNLGAAFALIREALAANARVLKDPEAIVQAIQLGESAVGIAVRPWVLVPDLTAATGEINAAVLAAFTTGGIIMPAPQRVVRLINTGT